MRFAAEAAGLTQREVGAAVAKAIDRPQGAYSEAAVGQWYSDKSEPTNQALVAFAKLTNANLIWLQTALGGGPGQLPREGRTVPTITMEQAIKVPIDDKSDHMVHTYYPCSDKAFIVPIADSRNEPDYRIGFKVVIDPLRKPKPGNMVLAVINREPVFGEYVEKAGKRVVIRPLNDKWPTEILHPKKGDRIVGTMTEFAGQSA
jgi:SOS-response transcriptional repressor LexA